jgi:hypothetical protein
MTGGGFEPDLMNIIFLGVCGACLGLAGLLAELVLRGRSRALAVPAVAFTLAAGAAFLGQSRPVWLALLALGGLLLAFRTEAVRRAWGRVAALGRDPRWVWGCLLVAAPSLAFWRAGLIEEPVPTLDDSEIDATIPLELACIKELPSPLAFTDKGRRVPLFRAEPRPMTPEALLAREATAVHPWTLSASVIRTAQLDLSHNCHGWTFAGSRYWVRDNDVDMILADNGYRLVKDPRPGDLAVYRYEPNGMVSHSGAVRVAGADGVVLVESKWGWLGRYLHAPADQRYGTMWTYHRSDRRGHLLRGLENDSPQALEATVAPGGRAVY